MKRLVSLLLAMSVMVSLAGCSLFDNKSFTVFYDISADPQNLDPQTASDPASLLVINNIFEGLFYIDELGSAQMGLAKSMERSSDGRTCTIQLREDAVWTNGEKVTAHDFVFALRRVLRTDTNSPAAAQFYSIRNAQTVHSGILPETQLGVKALSDSRLEINLEYENENLEYLLATTYALPCNEDFFHETKGKYGLQASKIMSNGAFDLSSWKHNVSIKLKRSGSYYDPKSVKPAAVNLYIDVSTPPAQRLADGKINAAIISGDDIEPFLTKKYHTQPIENATWGLYLNQKNKYLANDNIRKAITAGFDRSSYEEKLPASLKAAYGIVPHSIMLFEQSFRAHAGDNITQQFDAARAYEYYKAGLDTLKTQKIPALSLLINKDVKFTAAEYFSYPSQILQKELSIFINVEQVEDAEYKKRISAGDFDIALYQLSSADNSVSAILSSFLSQSNQNFISYTNEEYDRALNYTISSTKKQEIIEGYKSAEKKLIEDGVFIPMLYATDYFVEADVSGINYNIRTGLIGFKSAVES